MSGEEEDFGDEVIIECDGEDVVLDEGFDLPPLPPAPEKPPEDTITPSLRARFNPSSGAAMRLIKDLKEMMQSNSKELGFSCEPIGNDIFNWGVKVFGFDKGSEMHKDLQRYKVQTGRDWVDMLVTFHPDYPNYPPFVRVVQPRFMFHTGRVTVGGSLCTDILTMESWNPMYDIVGLMVNIFSEIMNGGPRIDFSNPRPYSLQEAREAFERVASQHHWKTSGWGPTK
jgi:ubiquitin-conjugating enzyme E2 Q